jgi:hypothetical protein
MFSNTTLPLFGTKDDPGLLDLMASGRLVVPRFQRPWVWTHPKTLALIRSVARKWPAGALLLTDGDLGFPSNTLHGVQAEVAKNVVYSVLDGQQRLTALYLTLNGLHPRHEYFVRLERVAEHGEAHEDDFEFWTKKRWRDTYPSTASQSAAGVITVEALVSDAQFFAWLSTRGGNSADHLVEARQQQLAGLSSYLFPVSIISANAPLEVLTNVFVTINQQGQRLSIFDLMVAKTWRDPEGTDGFDLRSEWTDAIGTSDIAPALPRLRDFDTDEVTPLRLVKILVNPAGSAGNAQIIDLAPAEVRTSFGRCLEAIDLALELLSSNAGVIPESLPSETGILPIAYVIARDRAILDSDERQQKLLRWFWASTLLQRYGRGGTNTIVGPDSTELYNWVDGKEQEPGWVTDFWTAFTPISLLEPQATNEVLMKAIFCLQNVNRACDWKTGEEIKSLGRAPVGGGAKPVSRLDQHHVFATGNPLPDSGGKLNTGEVIPSDTELIVNRVLILDKTNQSLHAATPGSLEEKGISLDFVASHLINPATLGSWDGFIRDRVDRIRAAVKTVLPEP